MVYGTQKRKVAILQGCRPNDACYLRQHTPYHQLRILLLLWRHTDAKFRRKLPSGRHGPGAQGRLQRYRAGGRERERRHAAGGPAGPGEAVKSQTGWTTRDELCYEVC